MLAAMQVLPADVGHRLPPWFFLMPSYWRNPKLDYVDEKLLAHLLAAGEQKVRVDLASRLNSMNSRE